MGFVNGMDTRWFKDRDVFGMVFHDPKSKVVGVLLQLGHKKVTLNHLVDVCFLCWFCLEKCLELVVFSQQETPTIEGFLISRPKCHPRFLAAFQATVGIHSGIHGGFFGWIYGESLRGGHWSQVSRGLFLVGFCQTVSILVFLKCSSQKG